MIPMASDHPSAENSLPLYLPSIEALLREMIRLSRLELAFTIEKCPPSADDLETPEYLVEFSGSDSDLLLEKNATLLNAFEHVVLKAARVEEEFFGRIAFDCQDWRRLRNEELRMTAQVAAERVIESGDPFTLSPMNPRERRIIHLALRERPDVQTKSEGFGAERKVVIFPTATPPRPGRR